MLSVLADAAYGIDAATATATLADDAALPKLSISDASVVEGDRGGAWVTVTVTLDAPSAQDVTVTVRTYGGTATAEEDYKSLVTTISFATGQTSVDVKLRVLSDTLREGNETFTVQLSSPTGAVLGTDVGTVTIIDDEGDSLTAATLGSGGASLDEPTLGAALADARAWWSDHGVAIGAVQVTLVDLPGRTLAIATSSGILLDIDAAGHGWGATGMDLATVLRHEIAHLFGLGHVEVDGHVMQALLSPGQVWASLEAGSAVVVDIPVALVATPGTVRTAAEFEAGVATSALMRPAAGSEILTAQGATSAAALTSPRVPLSGSAMGQAATVMAEVLAPPAGWVATVPSSAPLVWLTSGLLALGLLMGPARRRPRPAPRLVT